MALQDLLSKKELRKVEIQKDASKVDPLAALQQLTENKQKAEGTNMDKWYESLKDELIPSTLIPLSLDHAKSLVAFYEHHHLKKKPPTQQDEKNLENLAVFIEEEGNKTFPNMEKEGFFVRLNTRSPKDARIFSPEMFSAIKSDCEKLEHAGQPVSDNTKLNIIYVNFVKKMIVYSGKEAVDLLVNSHRIWQDITSAIDSIIDTFSMFVVVREWAHIHPSMEFRGFVYGQQLNAISSYNRAVCWPGIPEKIQEIESKCRHYWETIKGKIPSNLQNFIVDFAILEDSGKVTIVEFNDFADFEGCGANAELFDWVKDEQILLGKAPFETRLVMQPLTREQLEKTLTKPFKIHLGWSTLGEWVAGVDYY